jgi:AcrR family transcriptional regulator
VLDAAQAVVARIGAARLTLDAVAVEAGISKASVIYDYKSKQALIEAVVRRAMTADNAVNQAATEALGDVANPVVLGRIAAAADPLPPEGRAAALALCAALAQDAHLRTVMQDQQSSVLDAIQMRSAQPRGSLLAYLALEGLKLLESLDFHTFHKDQRDALLSEIAWLAEQQPSPPQTARPTAPAF